MFNFKKNDMVIFSPINGKILPLKEVPDKVFANKMMGEGVGLINNENKIYAPCDATVTMIPKTKHAVGLKGIMGVEILIHIGLNTVNLNGEGFTIHVKNGEKIRKGEVLVTFDKVNMIKKNIDLTTVMVITNSNDYNITILKMDDMISINSEIIKVTRK